MEQACVRHNVDRYPVSRAGQYCSAAPLLKACVQSILCKAPHLAFFWMTRNGVRRETGQRSCQIVRWQKSSGPCRFRRLKTMGAAPRRPTSAGCVRACIPVPCSAPQCRQHDFLFGSPKQCVLCVKDVCDKRDAVAGLIRNLPRLHKARTMAVSKETGPRWSAQRRQISNHSPFRVTVREKQLEAGAGPI